jgi:tetratricopeptide (TPR) repeat protein
MDNALKIVLNLSMFHLKGLRFYTNIFLLLFILSGCFAGQIENKESEFHYKMGLSFLNEGNIQMAFVQLQKAYQLNPEDKDILNSLGLVFLQLEKFDDAKEMFLKAIAIDPQFSDAYHNLGVTFMKKGQIKEATDAFNKALSNPLYLTPEKTFYLLGLSYYRLNLYEPAINAFKDSIRRAPSFSLPYFGLALAYNKIGRFSDASIAITKAIELDPLYKGDRNVFKEILIERLLSVKGDEEKDLKDFLEILHY